MRCIAVFCLIMTLAGCSAMGNDPRLSSSDSSSYSVKAHKPQHNSSNASKELNDISTAAQKRSTFFSRY